MNDPESLFNRYETAEGQPFYMIDRAVGFPTNPACGIYERKWVGEATAWTILSYKIYGTVEHWYTLAAINRAVHGSEYRGVLYAPPQSYVYYIPEGKLFTEILQQLG